jgi:hypothetical protein
MVYLKSLDPNFLKKHIKADLLNQLPENKELPPVRTHRRPLYRPNPDETDQNVRHRYFKIFN